MKSVEKIRKTADKVICALIMICVLSVMLPLRTSAYGRYDDLSDKKGIFIPYTASTPVLDGVAEEDWDIAESFEISAVLENVPGEKPVKGSMKLMWNTSFLFIFCEIEDEKVCGSESLGRNNDCLEFTFYENVSEKDIEDDEFEANPWEGNVSFLIYSEYKVKDLGDDINNNLRDYVAAEYKKTEKGYAVEALMKLSRTALIGDEFFFDTKIYSVSEENGEITCVTGLPESSEHKIVFTDSARKYYESVPRTTIMTVDMTYGYSKEKLLEMKKLYEPYVVCILSKSADKEGAIPYAFEKYSTLKFDKSELMILYNTNKVKLNESGTVGSKGEDCIFGFFTENGKTESFYVFVSELEEQYSAVRRAQASDIRSNINAMNKYDYPLIFCGNIHANENSFTYDIFGKNGLTDSVRKSNDIVKVDDNGTVGMYISEKSIRPEVCRMIYSDTQPEEQGAMVISFKLDASIEAGKAKRKTLFTVIEVVITAALAGFIGWYIYKKSKGKEKKC